MKKQGYYSSGQFAKMAHISVRTVRYYDKQNILKPSYVTESGARFYSEADFARLQQVLLLKYLGFTLEDIRNMLVEDMDYQMLRNSLHLQLKLVEDRIEQMQLVEKAIRDTTSAIDKDREIDWSQMLNLIHLTSMENSLKGQYQDAKNISARIGLHRRFAQNQQGWFPWVYEQCKIHTGMHILELGCGNGAIWKENSYRLPEDVHIVLNDISEGMLRDARRELGRRESSFSFHAFDCQEIPYEDDSFDLVMANHVLFYCDDLSGVLGEVRRVLKPEGRFICSTYGASHMQEITQMVQNFNNRIVLSAEKLYKQFGLENGPALLAPYFSQIEKKEYEDSLIVTEAEPLIEYILSCHGNQNQYILERYKDFRNFVQKKTQNGFRITKQAGLFVCNGY